MEEKEVLWCTPYTLEKEPIKEFKTYTLYQVYGIRDEEKVPLYKTCGR